MPIRFPQILRLTFLTMLCLGLVACLPKRLEQRQPGWADRLEVDPWALPATDPQGAADAPPGDAAQAPALPPTDDAAFYRPGSGEFLQPAAVPALQARLEEGQVTLNFQNADLQEVIQVVMGDMLQANYVIDPQVQGRVSMQTSQALPREHLLPTLELLLRMHDAALVDTGTLYRVVPRASAISATQAPQLGDSGLALPPGFRIQIVPLQHVAAAEMAAILEHFLTDGSTLLRVDSTRNLLILASDGQTLDGLLETVRIFDVDRMAGMSIALFTPDFVDAVTLGEELDSLLADPEQGLMPGLLRVLVIERLNGVLVISPRPDVLARAREWVTRLDRASGGAGQRLFVYRVRNGKAADLAGAMTELFEPGASAPLPPVELAPGMTAVRTASTPELTLSERLDNVAVNRRPGARNTGAANAEGIALDADSGVRIIADEVNNALMILASPPQYQQVLSALQQLDITPLQVLVEVTIAEVSLTDNLEYGVEWFFKNRVGEYRGQGLLDFLPGGIGLPAAPSFSYSLTNGDETLAVLSLLAEESNISVISSPSLLVLNNQEARIQVGDEISIKTAEQSSVVAADITDSGTALNSTFERRQTGVMLAVKPRVNPGGLVIMDIEQEVSNVPQSDIGSDNPRIQQRRITSSVAVQSGDTVMLGGLIRDNRDSSEAGVPGLHTLPLLGPLFGRKADNQDRTELLVLITPRAIPDRVTALQATEEFRRKLYTLPNPAPAPAGP